MNRLLSYVIRRGPEVLFDLAIIIGGTAFVVDMLVRAVLGQPS